MKVMEGAMSSFDKEKREITRKYEKNLKDITVKIKTMEGIQNRGGFSPPTKGTTTSFQFNNRKDKTTKSILKKSDSLKNGLISPKLTTDQSKKNSDLNLIQNFTNRKTIFH